MSYFWLAFEPVLKLIYYVKRTNRSAFFVCLCEDQILILWEGLYMFCFALLLLMFARNYFSRDVQKNSHKTATQMIYFYLSTPMCNWSI